MRTPLLASVLALLVPACLAGEITDLGGGDDGTGTGSGTGEGEGSGSGSGSGNDPTPRVTSSIDKTSVATELGKTETVTVTFKSAGGFEGEVAIDARLVDAADAVVPNVTLTGPESVSLTANGTGTAAFQIQIPTNATATAIEATLKLGISSSVGDDALMSQVTINNMYTVDYAAGTGNTAANHMNAQAPNIVVKRGAIVRFHNSDTLTHIIHGGGAFGGMHENTNTGGAPGRNYDVQTIAIQPGSTGQLGCHSHGTNTYGTYRVE